MSPDHGAPAAWPTLALLACPICHGQLEAEGDALLCRVCARSWSEHESGWLDFRAAAHPDLNHDWLRRQRSMEGWYGNLITASDQAEECYRHDYEPLAPLLGELRGLVLDVGGGNGITRQYLDPRVDYIDLDPSAEWLREDWLEVASSFPALRAPITFVLGAGEQLPFRSECFDAVLSLFSINHAAKPERLIAEAERVLRPGGRLLLVAEDVEPRWSDLIRPGYRAGWPPLGDSVRAKLAATLGRPWPVHPEHIPITETELDQWLAGCGLSLRGRSWIAGWLTLEAEKGRQRPR